MAKAAAGPPEALRRALALFTSGDTDAALRLTVGALAAEPDSIDALHLLGLIEARRGRLIEAERAVARAGAINPRFAAAHLTRARVLAELGRHDEAVASFDAALALRPDNAAGWVGRGNALRALTRLDDALASYDKALALAPGDADGWSNRGSILQGLNRLDDALASYDKALALRPEFAEAWSNRGNVLRDLGRIDDAIASHGKAQALKPDYAAAHWNESLCRLLAGDYARGWEQYEWRWKKEPLLGQKRDFTGPVWTGAQGLEGKTILLHAEQGFGDTIQFCRYAPLVAERGARVILEVQPALKSLLSRLTGVHRVLAKGETLPAFDFHCPLLSLPLAFRTTLETIPSSVPYIVPDAQLAAKWAARLPEAKGPRIGVVWAGNKAQQNNRNRSISLGQLAPLFEADAAFIGLQKELDTGDTEMLNRFGIRNLGAELADFSDTAAVLASMDAVVSVDTSVAHLAGAMGKPLFVVLARIGADWRWLLERADCPWYPTATLIRQKRDGDLEAALGRILPRIGAQARLHRPPGA